MFQVEYDSNAPIPKDLKISSFFNSVRNGEIKKCSFNYLKNVKWLDTGEYHMFELNVSIMGAHSVGLETCASLIFAKSSLPSNVLVYHVPSGEITDRIMKTIRRNLNVNNFDEYLVIYAHPHSPSKYLDAVNKLKAVVKDNNFIEIYNIDPTGINMFGIQSNGIIGH